MDHTASQKVQARHLRRSAYLYVRQSSMRQVFENSESTKRQYALRQRAICLGWGEAQIVVVDDDLGQSGSSASGRDGFQRLVTEVGMGRAGIVMGLEVSRLARNSSDWHRLLEMCALTDTLLLDEDGVYDPAHFNDRLVLGLKGTMSEAELHVLRARLQGGILNKARRGELVTPIPVGFVYDERNRVVLDPNARARETIEYFFLTFRRVGSAIGVVKSFRKEEIEFPRRVRSGAHRGELTWVPLTTSRALQILHNPRYAGAFFFGKSRQRRRPDGSMLYEKLPREEWFALVHDAHGAYISWAEFEENQRRLRENARAHGDDRRKSPPREGPALLQGLVLCGKCGARMTVRYNTRKDGIRPVYVCQSRRIEAGEPICQSIPGQSIDRAIGEILVQVVSPLSLEVAFAVQEELRTREDEAERLRRMEIESAQYEADLARRRYMQIDPENRLVADELEREWNDRLRVVRSAVERAEERRREEAVALDEEKKAKVMSLTADFPKLWKDPGTDDRDRKRIVRLLVEDVTLRRGQEIDVSIRFRGGATRSLSLALPPPSWVLRRTSPEVTAEIDRLLDHHTPREIVRILNERGLTSGWKRPFTPAILRRLFKDYGLRPRFDRLRDRGLLTLDEIAEELKVSTETIKIWRRSGLLTAHAFNDRPEFLYEPPGADAPVPNKYKGLSRKRSSAQVNTQGSEEAQYGT